MILATMARSSSRDNPQGWGRQSELARFALWLVAGLVWAVFLVF